MYGYVTHPGGLRLAGAEMLKAWAQAMGDSEEVAYLDTLIAAGKEAMQKYLWKGDHYLIYNDPKTGKTLDAFFSPTLNGQYFARYTGVPPVFPKENVRAFWLFCATRFARSANSECRQSTPNPMARTGKGQDGVPYRGIRLHQPPGHLERHHLHLRRPEGLRAGVAAQEP